MYTEYWHLKEKPFENSWDLRFFYLSPQHEESLARLLYAIKERRQGAILSGEYGSGKTMVMRLLLKKLEALKGYRLIIVTDPMLSPKEFIAEFLRQLGCEETPGDKPRLVKRLREEFVKIAEEEGHTIIIIDEAHLIPNKDSFEELRLLLNLSHPRTDKYLLTLFLLGQARVRSMIEQMPSLSQRMPVKWVLHLLDEKQTVEYIQHRLHVAGQSNQLFTDDALKLIFSHSRGIPRSINNICDLGLFLGFSRGAVKVDKQIIEEVAKNLEGSL